MKITSLIRNFYNSAIFLLLVSTISLLGSGFATAAPGNIRLFVGYPPGGSLDFIARQIAQSASEKLGIPIVVINQPGASGTTAATTVARSDPDGYTLLIGLADDQILLPTLRKSVAYNPVKDFAAVSRVADFPLLLAARGEFAPNNLTEVIALAKKTPNNIQYASQGIGSLVHIPMEMLMLQTGMRLSHVPYSGGAQALLGLVRGDGVSLMFGSPVLLGPQIKSGKVKAIVTTSEQRLPDYPSVPTMAEAGIPDFVLTGWYGIFAPSATPPAMIEKLSSVIFSIVNSPEYRKMLAQYGGFAVPQGSQDFSKFIDSERLRYQRAIKEGGITIND